MRRYSLLASLSASLVLVGCAGGGGHTTSSKTDNKPVTISVIHVNDTHSHVASEGMNLYFDGVKTASSVGGYPRVVSKIKALQTSKTNPLTLNAGDTFQGTLYYSIFKGEADATMLNQIAWDALALGNHEFDDGDAHLASYLKSLNLDSSKILSANIKAPENNILAGAWSPYTIKTYESGAKVGIIGIDIVGKTKFSSSPSDEIVFYDEIESAQKYIDELSAQGVNKIVLLTHVGLDNDKEYATKLSGVDVIVGGDSHSLMGDFSNVGLTSHESAYPFETHDKEGNKVCIAHAWQYNYVVGNFNVAFDENGLVTSCSGTPTLLTGESFTQDDTDVSNQISDIISTMPNVEIVAEDEATKAKLQTFSDQTDSKKAQKLATASERLGHNRIPNDNKDGQGELPLGSDIAPVVAKGFYDLSNRADACIQNAGGVRIPIEAGDVTLADAYTLLPFANTLFEIDMYGSEIKAVLEDAVDEALYGGSDGEISTGAFPYAYGLRYDVYSTEAKGNRIQNLEIKDRTSGAWSSISDAKMYVIVTNNYIAGGKDEYTTFKTVQDARGAGVDTYLDYAMSFVKYLEALSAEGKTLTKLPADEHPIKSFHTTTANMTKVGAYNTNKEGGSEIVAYCKSAQRAYSTNGEEKALDIIDISDVSAPKLIKSVSITPYGTGINSVSASNGMVAVAVENGNDSVGKKQLKGAVVLFDADGNHQATIEAGFLPDMLTFNEDGSKIVVANEGEPNDNYDVDPIGSVGIIDVATKNYTDVTFESVSLTPASDGTSVRLGNTPSNNQAKDLEPEYVAISGAYAYVTLQENNALAKINLNSASVEFVKSFGAKSYESENSIDIEENGNIEMKNFKGLFGLYQPDSIAAYTIGETTYLVTANEGDGREYESDTNSFVDEEKISKLNLDASIASVYENDNDLKVMVDLGDTDNDGDYDKLYTYGARSFSIWSSEGELVYDSGDSISKTIAQMQPTLFNQDEGEMDGRSGNKGGEPEALAVGQIGEKFYAFVGLERQNAIMIYDITNPIAPEFIEYYISEDEGDISAEGMKFVPASLSPNGKNLLLVSYEVSGSTVVYELGL